MLQDIFEYNWDKNFTPYSQVQFYTNAMNNGKGILTYFGYWPTLHNKNQDDTILSDAFYHPYDGEGNNGGNIYLTSRERNKICPSLISFDFRLRYSFNPKLETLTSPPTNDRIMYVQVLDSQDKVVFEKELSDKVKCEIKHSTTDHNEGIEKFTSERFVFRHGTKFKNCVENGKLRFRWYIPEHMTGPAAFIMDNIIVTPLQEHVTDEEEGEEL